ncbi:MAG: right-handed parallel beta-helix repeat-containing protein [Polyangiales bacterium]
MNRLVLLAIVAVGCHSGGDDSKPSPTCAATELMNEGVCVASGVDACAEGFESDGAGGCKAILPDTPCTGATIATPGDRACRPVGVETCAEGFATDESDQCVSIAGEECTSGTLTVLGSLDCMPVSDCGTTTWGPLPIDPGAIYVDGTFAKGGSDGSADRPFVDLASAIALADATRKQIVLAEGIYEHGGILEKSVEFRGRCADRVVIAPPKGSTSPAITVRADATFRSLSIGSETRGLQIESGTTKLVHAAVQKTGAEGIVVTKKGVAVELEDSVVDSTNWIGILVVGGSATLTRSTVRQTIAAGMGGGAGLWVNKGEAHLVASSVERNDRFGLYAEGSTVTIDRSSFRGNEIVGGGTAASLFSVGGSNTTIKSSTFEGNTSIGIYAADGILTLENTVISGTSSTPGVEPTGLWAAVDPNTKNPATVVVKNSTFVRNQGSGMFLAGAAVTIDRTLFRDQMPSDSDQSGDAIVTTNANVGTHPPDVTVRDSLIERATNAGITVTEGKMTVERSVIREGVPTPSGKWGVGVAIYSTDGKAKPSLELRGSLVERVHDAGIFALGTDVVVDRSLIRDMLQRKNGTYGHGIHLSVDTVSLHPANGTVTGSVIDGAFEVGITAFRSNVTVERTTVVRTSSGAGTGAYGDGISVAGNQLDDKPWSASSLVVRRSRIDGSARAGISIFEADATLEGVILTCNAFSLNIESLHHPTNVSDAGGNGCACGAPLGYCIASSANLHAVSSF